MANFNNIMKERVINNILSETKQNKKQISTFFTQNIINKLDKCVNDLKENSLININRNSLIEFAVETLVDNYNDAIKEYQEKHKTINKKKELDFDTIVCPSNISGFSVFLDKNKWYYVRINEEKISKIKYIALYVGSPLSRIDYYAKVKRIVKAPELDVKKYIIEFDGDPIKLKKPIELGDMSPLATRSPRYTTLIKLKAAKTLADL